MYQTGVTPSTTRGSAPRKITKPPARQHGSPTKWVQPEPGPLGHRRAVTVTLQWVGKGEPWIRLTQEGKTCLRPGTMALFELVLWLNGWRS